jgi:HPt (histidine-containing phosphotransfer) domain-containing protein
VQDRAHKLAGIAAMFGHPDVGEAALALELAAEAGDPIGPAAARLDTLLAAIG